MRYEVHAESNLIALLCISSIILLLPTLSSLSLVSLQQRAAVEIIYSIIYLCSTAAEVQYR